MIVTVIIMIYYRYRIVQYYCFITYICVRIIMCAERMGRKDVHENPHTHTCTSYFSNAHSPLGSRFRLPTPAAERRRLRSIAWSRCGVMGRWCGVRGGGSGGSGSGGGVTQGLTEPWTTDGRVTRSAGGRRAGGWTDGTR